MRRKNPPCGDSIELLQQLADNSVDAVIIDPPYCNGGQTANTRAQTPSSKYEQSSNVIVHRPDFVGNTMMGTFWYADQAISNFIEQMKRCYKDSLFIFTGDHGGSCGELQHTSLMQRTYTFRELHCPVFMMQHPDITQDIFAGNMIGGHMTNGKRFTED